MAPSALQTPSLAGSVQGADGYPQESFPSGCSMQLRLGSSGGAQLERPVTKPLSPQVIASLPSHHERVPGWSAYTHSTPFVPTQLRPSKSQSTSIAVSSS